MKPQRGIPKPQAWLVGAMLILPALSAGCECLVLTEGEWRICNLPELLVFYVGSIATFIGAYG